MSTPSTPQARSLERVTGVELAQGLGVQPAKGFWADAWSQVVRRPRAIAAIAWLSLVTFCGITAPILASGHPLVMRDAATGAASYPLWSQLSSADVLILVGAIIGVVLMVIPIRLGRGARLGVLVMGALQAGLTVGLAGLLAGAAKNRNAADWLRSLEQSSAFEPGAASIIAGIVALAASVIPWAPRKRRITTAIIVGVLSGVVVAGKWSTPLERFDYREREASGKVTSVYTVVPYSPFQGDTGSYIKPPGSRPVATRDASGQPVAYGPIFTLGSDALGQDVLAQMLHASRLAITIGLVSTGIAVFIGVTIGALAGYFGGWIDMFLQRVIEIFMAIPVLFLLIVAAGVLPHELRSTYVMMAIIGLVSWTGAARFTRAEFYRLRNQDFVQAAKAAGLPLPSILFRHMLPNGVTPVLVDASFAIAAAILAEAVLSFLGLGPEDQASWGKLLSSATNTTGTFNWWLAIFPGSAIFLTVLSYNVIGESLRDAIDPKLKKARV